MHPSQPWGLSSLLPPPPGRTLGSLLLLLGCILRALAIFFLLSENALRMSSGSNGALHEGHLKTSVVMGVCREDKKEKVGRAGKESR